jgi:hypothetical protein
VEIDAREVIEQLTNPMKSLKSKGLAGDVDRVELIMRDGARFKDRKHMVKDGYLFDSNAGKTVTLDNFPNFIMIIRL